MNILKPFISLLEPLFFPKKKVNVFNTGRYIRDLESGMFRDKFNLGIQENGGGTWRLKDFTLEPNAVFGGAMGSGKSRSTVFSLATWMASNSDQTVMFITDPLKGANEYKELFQLPQVYSDFSEKGIHKIVDLLFDEIAERKRLFGKVQAESIFKYEKAVKKWNRNNPKDKMPEKMTRCILVMEEFHAVPYTIMSFGSDFKKEHTTANKFHKIMRVGRSYGIWVVACSQKMTSSDIPSEIIPNFTQKQIFSGVSKAESTYFLGNTSASSLNSDQKGRCSTEEGYVQVPFLPDNSIRYLMEHYAKPLKAENAFLSDQIIKDYLAGKSTKELFKFKRLPDLVSGIKNFDHKVIIEIIHEKLGHKVEIPKKNVHAISHIVHMEDKNGNTKKVAILARINQKLTSKHIQQLNEAMAKYKCQRGIIYTTETGLTKAIYSEAVDKKIELVDHEDMIVMAQNIDSNNLEFDETQLASDDKESGAYQKEQEKKEVISKEKADFLAREEAKIEAKKIEDEKNQLEADIAAKKLAKALIENEEVTERDEIVVFSEKEILLDDSLDQVKNEDIKEKIVTKPENSSEQVKNEDIIQDVSLDEVDLSDLDLDNDSGFMIDEEESVEEVKDEIAADYSDFLLASKRDKKLKKVNVKNTFSLKSDTNTSLLLHALRNESGDIYRVLFAVIKNKEKEIHHKFYLDKMVEGEFSIKEMRRLDITSAESWNELPQTLDDNEFNEEVLEYFKNFDVCEFPVRSYTWEEDIEFFKKYLTKKVEIPKSIGKIMKDMYDFDEAKREYLLDELGISDVDDSLFNQILRDFELWVSSS